MNDTVRDWINGRSPQQLRAEAEREHDLQRRYEAARLDADEEDEQRCEKLDHMINRAVARRIAFIMLADEAEKDAAELAAKNHRRRGTA